MNGSFDALNAPSPCTRSARRVALWLVMLGLSGCADDLAAFEEGEGVALGHKSASLRSLPGEDPTCKAWSDADFYAWSVERSDQLNGAARDPNGSLVRCQTGGTASIGGLSYARYRVLYVTSLLVHDAGSPTEEKRIASGTVFVPTSEGERPAPRSSLKRPVIAQTHGTSGITPLPAAAPSRGYYLDSTVALEQIVAALPAPLPTPLFVAPDYLGLGVDPGYRVPNVTQSPSFSNVTHPWLSIESEGRATIDLVRAAQAVVGETPDNVLWLVHGQSQGGHAALATAEVHARDYGSETILTGSVAGCPASELDDRRWWAPEFKPLVFSMAMVSAALEHPGLPVKSYFNAFGYNMFGRTANVLPFADSILPYYQEALRCLINPFCAYRDPRDATQVTPFVIDPFSHPATLEVMRENSPGRSAVDVPLFVGSIPGDPILAEQRVDLFLQKARALNAEAPIASCKYPRFVHPVTDSAFEALPNHNAFGRMFPTGAQGAVVCEGLGGMTDPSDPQDTPLVAGPNVAAAFAGKAFAKKVRELCRAGERLEPDVCSSFGI